MTETIGRCHTCEETRDIDYCPTCEHWFCEQCKRDIPRRVWSFILEKLGGRTPGCCGPE